MEDKKYNYLITHSGRNPSKTFDKMLELDTVIRQKDKFPILYITNEQTAVIISVEEYKELKKLKELLTQNFDVSTQANEIIAKGGIITGYSLTPRGIEVEGRIPYEKRPKE